LKLSIYWHRRIRRSLEQGQLTEFDSYVPPANVREVSAFPAGDQKVFPVRRPQTGAWKLGLRQYEDTSHHRERGHGHGYGAGTGHGKDDGTESVGHSTMDGGESVADDSSVKSFGSLSTASKAASGSVRAAGKLKRQVSDVDAKLRPTGSAAKLNTFLHTQYATEELPKLTRELQQKYFGPSGTETFFKTYRELKSRGEVLLDGYADLERLVTRPAEKNVFLRSVEELQNLGVLTPRALNEDGSHGMSPLGGSFGALPAFSGLEMLGKSNLGAHPSTLPNPKVTGMVNDDGMYVSEATLSKVVTALHDSSVLQKQDAAQRRLSVIHDPAAAQVLCYIPSQCYCVASQLLHS
jgi:hypothetical protein